MGIEALKSEELKDYNRKEVSLVYLRVKRVLDFICSLFTWGSCWDFYCNGV